MRTERALLLNIFHLSQAWVHVLFQPPEVPNMGTETENFLKTPTLRAELVNNTDQRVWCTMRTQLQSSFWMFFWPHTLSFISSDTGRMRARKSALLWIQFFKLMINNQNIWPYPISHHMQHPLIEAFQPLPEHMPEQRAHLQLAP